MQLLPVFMEVLLLAAFCYALYEIWQLKNKLALAKEHEFQQGAVIAQFFRERNEQVVQLSPEAVAGLLREANEQADDYRQRYYSAIWHKGPPEQTEKRITVSREMPKLKPKTRRITVEG